MHALPIKPRHIVVRAEHEKQPIEHPPHLSPKHVHMPAHSTASPPKPTSPLETHRVDAEAEDEASLGSHRLPQHDLERIHSVQQHPIVIEDEEQ
ncbi:hypothetical protein Ndes2526B_g01986 [Nannochloris sp. 'desiccata']|nr:hypothetical protein NADE_002730 [Chlorella desiccata (nom. nud.)]